MRRRSSIPTVTITRFIVRTGLISITIGADIVCLAEVGATIVVGLFAFAGAEATRGAYGRGAVACPSLVGGGSFVDCVGAAVCHGCPGCCAL